MFPKGQTIGKQIKNHERFRKCAEQIIIPRKIKSNENKLELLIMVKVIHIWEQNRKDSETNHKHKNRRVKENACGGLVDLHIED